MREQERATANDIQYQRTMDALTKQLLNKTHLLSEYLYKNNRRSFTEKVLLGRFLAPVNVITHATRKFSADIQRSRSMDIFYEGKLNSFVT